MVSSWFVAALANLVVVHASSGPRQQIGSHLLFARQNTPQVGQRCPNRATDKVCVVRPLGSGYDITCSYDCCTNAQGAFVTGCGFGDRCLYDSNHNFQTCCPVGLPASQCSRATACVNAGQTAAEPTQVCPTATPICSVDPILGAGCTGSFSDYLTLTQSGPASTPTGPASESSTPSSSAAESTPTPASQYTPPSSTAKASPTTAESTSTTVKTSSTTERTTSVIAATYSPATASTTTTAKAATSTPVILPLPTTVVATTSTPAAFTGGEAAVRPIWGLLVSLAVAVGLGMTLRV